MNKNSANRQLALKIINKTRWANILSRFSDVLRINIFVVDSQGEIILPPNKIKYGGRLLFEPALGVNLLSPVVETIKKYKDYTAKYIELTGKFHLHVYAIPITIPPKRIIAYMIIGPIILNKRMENDEYKKIAETMNIDKDEVLDEINITRVVSNVMMNSILELLADIVKNGVELSLQKWKTGTIIDTNKKQPIPSVSDKINSDSLKEYLATLLELSLKITNADAGSIMLMDEDKKVLSVKVAKGPGSEKTQGAAQKLGEGIAGVAAKENSLFIINGQQGDNRIKHLLKRPEIKQSLVMPLSDKNRILGVLNLHTQKTNTKVEDTADNLKYISKLLASVY